MKKNFIVCPLVIFGLIIALPTLFTQPAFFDVFDFSNSGQIGDTIGGITAPFISCIAAVLVYLALREQVKANELINAQIISQQINDQINRLEDGSERILSPIRKIKEEIDEAYAEQIEIQAGDSYKFIPVKRVYNIDESMGKIEFILGSFSLIEKNLLDRYPKEAFFFQRLSIIYESLYKLPLSELKSSLEKAEIVSSPTRAKEERMIEGIEKLDKLFSANRP